MIILSSSTFRMGRIQNFENWSPAMVPEAGKTCLVIEYFCSEGDDLWELRESQLTELAPRKLST